MDTIRTQRQTTSTPYARAKPSRKTRSAGPAVGHRKGCAPLITSYFRTAQEREIESSLVIDDIARRRWPEAGFPLFASEEAPNSTWRARAPSPPLARPGNRRGPNTLVGREPTP